MTFPLRQAAMRAHAEVMHRRSPPAEIVGHGREPWIIPRRNPVIYHDRP
jgi:hypothetical protein